jgi:pimeloyl-ACP methyl ester carboxylesterase
VGATLPALAAFSAFASAAPVTTPDSSTPTFSEYSPLSTSAEIMRRLLSPLAAREVQRSLERSGEHLRDQSIDLAAERFALYVPPQAPPSGFALLVFIPPWDEAQLPHGWASVLDRYGVIFVSAAHSANSADPVGRRAPLALLAAYNVMRRYRVDPQRVYVGGFSGGSRIALRLALAYPDLFRGALLNAGSDPLDAGPPSPPERALLERFQESTRIVFVTGEHDLLHLASDRASLESMSEWCAFDTAAEITPGAGHEIASSMALSRALGALASHVRPDAARLAACRHALDERLAARLARIGSLIDAGRSGEARKLLEETDRQFGGLAAPQSVALSARLE